MLSRVAGKTINYVPLTEEIASAALKKAGFAGDLIERWTEFYRKVRQGLCAPFTHDVESVLCRPPTTFEQYAKDYAASWK